MLILLNILLLATPLFAQEQLSNITIIDKSIQQTTLDRPETVSVSVGKVSVSEKKNKKMKNTNALPVLTNKTTIIYKSPSQTSIQDSSTNYQAIEEFFHFIRIGDIDSVTEYLNKGVNPDIRKLPDLTNGMTALMCSVANRRFLVTQLLLSYRADPNLSLDKLTVSNISPLMLAAQQGPIETVDYLLDYGSDIDARTTGEITGNTALLVAIQIKKYDTIELLLDRGADINNSSGRGITPLMLAAQTGDIDIVNLLLSYPKINIKAVDIAGKNALVYGYISGNIELIELFIQLKMTTDLSPEEIRTITKKYL
jgi:ankyrin repeat protein